MSKSVHVELNNSTDNLTIKLHLFVEAKEIAWNLGFKMYIALEAISLWLTSQLKKLFDCRVGKRRSNCLLYIFSNTTLNCRSPIDLDYC